ncbi:polysaccharide deacetylase family protein [Fundicoccus culcitae]|uniref:Polysaccharide deacetylase family protein n=1 Tax=Fundicoccus culcitae TaxID=2969821 RepID=A0ABY5P8C4_9LACT|nr:polysaccharide deacetylase family protein [Fundicoccus culcitae]UUX34635.1 polysaccharide deacetylase family protein [Fundicoccus culcitae]
MKINNKIKHYLTWLILIIINLLLLFYMWTDMKALERDKLVESAQTDLNQLYFDHQHDFLDENITQKIIDDKVTQYSNIDDDQIRDTLNDIELRYGMIQTLNQIYVDDEPMIVGNRINDSNIINENLSLDELKHLQNEMDAALPRTEDDRLFLVFNEKMTFAEQTLQTIEDIEISLLRMDNQMTTESINQDLDQMKAIQAQYEKVSGQPKAQKLEVSYYQLIDQITQLVENNISFFNENKEVNHKIFENEALADRLLGTEVDHRPLIALTFDDGPNETTLQILDVLEKHEVHATFFQLGMNVVEYPEISKKVYEKGHKIGNHSFSHANYATISDDEVKEEMRLTQEAVATATGATPKLYRMPYGIGGQRVVEMFPDLQTVFWNIDSLDWEFRDSDKTVSEIMNTVKHRSIVLMHDIYPENVETLDRIIPYLKDQGYIFCFPDQILDADTYLD